MARVVLPYPAGAEIMVTLRFSPERIFLDSRDRLIRSPLICGILNLVLMREDGYSITYKLSPGQIIQWLALIPTEVGNVLKCTHYDTNEAYM